jgi:hypothetical protein
MKKLIQRFLSFFNNKMLERYPFKAKGTVSIYKWEYNNWKLYYFFNNAIQAIAKEVVAERLAENNLVRIDQIELLNGGLSLAVRDITERIVPPGELDSVTFNAIFDEASFSGSFTEARLISSAKGDFSIVTGLSLSKSPTEKIMISWKIKIA